MPGTWSFVFLSTSTTAAVTPLLIPLLESWLGRNFKLCNLSFATDSIMSIIACMCSNVTLVISSGDIGVSETAFDDGSMSEKSISPSSIYKCALLFPYIGHGLV
jgi:hypothetical protein